MHLIHACYSRIPSFPIIFFLFITFHFNPLLLYSPPLSLWHIFPFLFTPSLSFLSLFFVLDVSSTTFLFHLNPFFCFIWWPFYSFSLSLFIFFFCLFRFHKEFRHLFSFQQSVCRCVIVSKVVWRIKNSSMAEFYEQQILIVQKLKN